MSGRNLYHLSNICTLLFIGLVATNIMFRWDQLIGVNRLFVTLPMLLIGIGLRRLAIRKQEGVQNPIRERKVTHYLNIGGFVVIALGVLLAFALESLEIHYFWIFIVLGALMQVAAIIISLTSFDPVGFKDEELLDAEDLE